MVFFLNLKDLNSGQLDSSEHGAALFNHQAFWPPAPFSRGWNPWSCFIDFERHEALYAIHSHPLILPAPLLLGGRSSPASFTLGSLTARPSCLEGATFLPSFPGLASPVTAVGSSLILLQQC